METQKFFFEIVKNRLSPNLRLADVVGDVLSVGSDSAYRRIRGEKELTLNETAKLCRYFDISLDSVINLRSDNIPFKYTPLDLKDMNNYYTYMKGLAALFDSIAKSGEKEICFMAIDIPVAHFTPFLELTLFKIYTWFQSINNLQVTYDRFVSGLDIPFLVDIYAAIDNAYKQIPSTEIWTNSTLDPLLHLIDYYFDMNCFEKKETADLIGYQLYRLIENMEKYAGKEEKAKAIPFRMYLSPIDLMNDFMISKRDGITVTSIKLYTINGIFTSNEFFCSEVEKWMQNTVSKSLRLSGASEKERYKFFQNLKNKTNYLLEKFR
ncbi:MAG: hypothetical protein LBI65_00925 [Candidatus Symbiothrix sp.]|jgi:hypothetical protein|nr:hypothetical protein [Candidatus Symbiothrix sp.]